MKRVLMKNSLRFIFGLLFFIFAFSSCSQFIKESEEEQIDVKSISLSSSSLELNAGAIQHLSLSINPSNAQKSIIPKWTFDNSYISLDGNSFGATIKALHEGTTYVKCEIQGISATCLLTINGNIEEIEDKTQYIYSNFSVIEVEPGESKNISVSLFNGSSDDLENFEWSIEDNSVASIDFSRNNCLISAKKNGTTILTAKHPNCAYPYSLIIFSHSDSKLPSYISTLSNVVFVNANEVSSKTIDFNVENPISSFSNNKFTFEDTSDEKSKGCFSFTTVNNQVVITPIKNGLGRFTVHNEECEYDLDILVKVKVSADNVYLSTSTSTLIVDGSDETFSISASVEGYSSGIVDSSLYKWEIDENYKTTKPVNLLCDWYQNENTVSIKGKMNGVFKMKVSHPLSTFSKTVMVVLKNQDGNKIDASMYITTNSNFVSTKVGSEESVVEVRLFGGKNGDENGFVWSVSQNDEIIDVLTSTGVVSSRAAATDIETYAYGTIHIEPKKKGTATIYVGHEKCLYETEILVKVYSADALLSNPITIDWDSTSPYISLVNGKTKDVTVQLNNASISEESKIEWTSSDSSKVSILSSGKNAVLTACGFGQNQTYITIKHPKAINEKRILVLTADTEEELSSMKAIFSQNTYIRLNENKTATLSLETLGFTEEELGQISWTSSNSSVCVIDSFPNGANDHRSVKISGIRAGHSTVKASFENCKDVIFDIVVLSEDESVEVINDPYLTTSKNAIVIPNKNGGTEKLSVVGVNMSDSDLSKTTWNEFSSSLLQVTGNGSICSITAQGFEGKTKVKAKNPKSMNELSFDVKIGSYYEYTDNIFPYIVSDNDTYSGLIGSVKNIGFYVENSDSVGKWNFSITQGNENAEIVSFTDGKQVVCSVNLLKRGQAILKVSNSLTESVTGSKEILLIIADTLEELSESLYMTTEKNVLTLGNDESTTVSISIPNAKTNISNGFHWSSSNDVISIFENGNTAVLTAKKVGTSKITVSNDSCDYPLSIIVTVVDLSDVSINPYIVCDSVVTVKVGDDYREIIADLVGGTKRDFSNFSWNIEKGSDVIEIFGENETCKIKGKKEGTALISISHQKSLLSRNILVICDKKDETNYYISPSESVVYLSLEDEPKTITADLVNGGESDIYDFSWKLSNESEYGIIDIIPAQNSCVIKPLSTGTANIILSHSKSKTSKTIVVTVTQFTSLNFETSYVTVKKGKSIPVNLQVPTSSFETIVKYSSSNQNIMKIGLGSTNNICVVEGISEGNAVLTATLYSKSNNKILGTCQTFVYVEEDE